MVTGKKSTLKMLFFLKKKKLLKNGEAPILMRISVMEDTLLHLQISR